MVLKGLEQLHRDLQTQAQWITKAEEKISSMKDESTAVSDDVADSHTPRELQEKLEDLENHSRQNNLCIIGFLVSYSAAMLVTLHANTIPEQLGLPSPCAVE